MTLLLSGCGAQSTAQGTSTDSTASETTTTSASANSDQAQQGQPKASMDPQQFKMMSTFRSLISMDKMDGLAITKEQAEQLLPIVQESVKNITLTAENESKLIEKLTVDQKKYLSDNAANMQKRMANGGGNNNGSPRPSPSAEQQKKRDEARKTAV